VSVRTSDRPASEIRPTSIEIGVNKHAEGSALIRSGDTHVLCTASVDEKVPGFLQGSGEGWITAEYGMLPRATSTRAVREATRGRPTGRSQEIQRLIGRSLRAVVDRRVLGERTIFVDCDVLQADGGTRCASITGAFVALASALDRLRAAKKISGRPLLGQVAAISAGVCAGEILVDLDYPEDSAAEVDLNVVRLDGDRYVELQGTAEETAFGRSQLTGLLDLADAGIEQLFELQREVLGATLGRLVRGGEDGR
jgi:ribonuclease PH